MPAGVDLLFRAVKTGGAAALGGLAAIWAQVEIPALEGLGSIGLVGVLAVLIGRYTFRQLEDYRRDLKAARDRIDELEGELHKLGQAKATTDHRNRELEAYAHRLELWAASASSGRALDLPKFPERPSAPA